MITKLAKKNLRANLKNIIPFIISNAIVYAVLFVMVSLTQNEYVRTRHVMLKTMMQFGAAITSFIALIFTIYSQRSIMKRRYRELSLYQVLGLEKKHVSSMLFKESLIIFVIVSILSVLTGYFFGIFSFLVLRKSLNFTLDAFNIFKFETTALIFTIGILLVGFILNIIINIFKISRKSPTELMQYEKEAEKEPKINFITLIIGLICLIVSYIVANKIKLPESFIGLFICIFVIVIATYLLFSSLSIFILKAKRKNKKYYYKQENFLSISNLLYRMKSNAISLATITVLCSGVIIALSVSYTLGRSMAEMKLDADYQIDYHFKPNEMLKKDRDDKIKYFDKELEKVNDKKYFLYYQNMVKINSEGEIENLAIEDNMFSPNSVSLTVTTFDEYNKLYSSNLEKLSNNEVYLSTEIKGIKQIKLGDKTFIPKKFSGKQDPFMAMNQSYILVNDTNIIDNFINKLNEKESKNTNYSLKILVNDNKDENLESYLTNFAKQQNLRFTSNRELWQFVQEFSGEFFFLGVLISIVFMVVTSLVLYFKQLSEAYEDKNNYIILKKLGVSETTAINTIKRQMKSVFILPVLVAVIHNIVLVRVVSQMLALFGTRGNTYLINLIILSAIFTIVYIIIYSIVQRSYKKIVWG